MASALFSTVNSEAVVEPRTRARPILLGLLAVSVFINYIDRGNLSIAAPALKDELGLSASQLGILLSSFFWSYGFFQILSGWLVDRFHVNWVMAIGFFLWSAATGATAVAHGFAALLAVRIILGIGESVAYPSYSKILAKYFPESQRGFANSVIASGLACGPAFGILLGGMLMARFGWRSFFLAVGILSLLWLPPWFRWMPRGPGLAPTQHLGTGPSTLDILKQRPAWGSFIAMFCAAYLLYFLIAWLPFYLVRERHFSMDTMAKIGGAVFLTQALSSTACGRRTRVHKTFMIAGSLGCGAFLLASVFAGPALSVGLLMLVGASCGMCMSNTWPIAQNLAGPQASGRWTGLQCAVGNSSGAAGAALTGFILDRTGHFFWAFAIAAGVVAFGALCWMFLVGPIKPVVWTQQPSAGAGKTAVKLG